MSAPTFEAHSNKRKRLTKALVLPDPVFKAEEPEKSLQNWKQRLICKP